MLDKTKDDDVVVKPVDTSAPAIFVRVSDTAGQPRIFELSFGIPLDMRPKELNKYLDKVTACIDRQRDKSHLEDARQRVRDAYKKIEEINDLAAGYQAKQEAEWYAKGKLGAWQPTGSQAAELKNHRTNIAYHRDNIIPTWSKIAEVLERKIAEEE